MKTIDLHTHSTASDGSMEPCELIRHAKESGLAAVAITDHDTVDGVEEALREGERIGIEVIAGVEISASFDPEMHILGYFFNDTYKNIEPVLKNLRMSRNKRNPQIIKKLQELGFDISLREVEGIAKGEVVARPHIAEVMVRKGYAHSIRDVFDRYITPGKPAYVKRDKLDPEEGIKEIVRAGGIPVIAHPIYLNLSYKELNKLVARLVKVGLGGIETFYVDNTNDDTGNLLRIALEHGIVPTGGSDFHGTYKKDICIGVGRGNLKVPYESLEKLKEII